MTHRRNGRTWTAIAAVAVTVAAAMVMLAVPAMAQSDISPTQLAQAQTAQTQSKPLFSKPKERVTKMPECRCQNYGNYLLVGQVACIRTNKGPRMARCIMKGNNTMWDFLSDTCPTS